MFLQAKKVVTVAVAGENQTLYNTLKKKKARCNPDVSEPFKKHLVPHAISLLGSRWTVLQEEP